LIQKEQDHWFKVLAQSRPKTVLPTVQPRKVTPVSVLDLETVSFLTLRSDAAHTRAHQTIPMFFSLYDVNFVVRHPFG
jgi:hypothetical protein